MSELKRKNQRWQVLQDSPRSSRGNKFYWAVFVENDKPIAIFGHVNLSDLLFMIKQKNMIRSYPQAIYQRHIEVLEREWGLGAVEKMYRNSSLSEYEGNKDNSHLLSEEFAQFINSGD